MIGDSTDSRVGIGSRGHEALDAFLMMDVISDVVAGLKLCSSEADDERRELTGGQFKSLVEILCIFTYRFNLHTVYFYTKHENTQQYVHTTWYIRSEIHHIF